MYATRENFSLIFLEWKQFFKQAGIMPKDLKDPESLNIIMNVVGSIKEAQTSSVKPIPQLPNNTTTSLNENSSIFPLF